MHVQHKKTDENKSRLLFLAEGEGFEPPEALTSAVFKTVAIDHSANLPTIIYYDGCRRSTPIILTDAPNYVNRF